MLCCCAASSTTGTTARASCLLTDFERFHFAKCLSCRRNSIGHNFHSSTSLFQAGTFAVFKGAQRCARSPPQFVTLNPIYSDSGSGLPPAGALTRHVEMRLDWQSIDTDTVNGLGFSPVSMRPTIFIRQRSRTKFYYFR